MKKKKKLTETYVHTQQKKKVKGKRREKKNCCQQNYITVFVLLAKPYSASVVGYRFYSASKCWDCID